MEELLMGGMWPIIVAVGWISCIICAIVCVKVSSKKGYESKFLWALIGLYGNFVGVIIVLLATDKKAVAFEKNMPEFYRLCQSQGIYQCETPKERQKAELVAKRLDMQYDDIKQLFETCKSYAENKERIAESQQAASELNQLKAAETRKKNELEKYASYIYAGSAKRVAMLQEYVDKYHAEAQKMRDVAKYAHGQFNQKEEHWELWGGFADGLAGPAAGVAAAAASMQRNEEIREQNRINEQTMAPVMVEAVKQSAKYKEYEEKYIAEVEEAKLKLVAEDTPKECFDRLILRDSSVTVSETGTCTVTVKARLKNTFNIFEDVKAVVDGNIKAKIYDGADVIGTAVMVLPINGINSDSNDVSLEGMCLFCANRQGNYIVEFEPGNLWAMEF